MVETHTTLRRPTHPVFLTAGDLVDRYWTAGSTHLMEDGPHRVTAVYWDDEGGGIRLRDANGIRYGWRRFNHAHQEILFSRVGEFGPAAWPTPNPHKRRSTDR